MARTRGFRRLLPSLPLPDIKERPGATEDEMWEEIEEREFGPRYTPENPRIKDVPGDLREDRRKQMRHLLMGRLRTKPGRVVRSRS